MRRRARGFGVVIAFLVAAHATAGPSARDVAKIDAVVRSFMARETISAAHVTVFQGGKTLLERGYGSVGPGSGPPDSRSVFPIGSISKHFTAAAIVALADQGKLRLDAPVGAYLPQRYRNNDRARSVCARCAVPRCRPPAAVHGHGRD